MNNEFDAEAFWEAFEEDRQDREFFAQKIQEQQIEEKSNIIKFPLTLRFEMDIDAIEKRLSSLLSAISELQADVASFKKRFVKEQ